MCGIRKASYSSHSAKSSNRRKPQATTVVRIVQMKIYKFKKRLETSTSSSFVLEQLDSNSLCLIYPADTVMLIRSVSVVQTIY